MKLLSRSRLQLSLRAALLLLTVGCVVLGFFSARVSRQRAAVRAILQAGGRVTYEHKIALGSRNYESAPSIWPASFRVVLGDDWLYDVEGVTLYGEGCRDEMLPLVARLPKVKKLALWPHAQAPRDAPMGGKMEAGPLAGVTDEGLQGLAGHPSIEFISFGGNQVTDRGLEYLKKMPRLREIQPDELMTSEGVRGFMQAVAGR